MLRQIGYATQEPNNFGNMKQEPRNPRMLQVKKFRPLRRVGWTHAIQEPNTRTTSQRTILD